jgi:prepilin-type N-terminal cleavage/methylation domain-containing protein
MPNLPGKARGFTVIELMIVVTIIGLISSVAIPSYNAMRLRSKQTERAIMVTQIQRSIDEYWMREGHYPLWNNVPGNEYSQMYLTYWNPDSSPTAQKRPWRQRPLNQWDHWNNLSLLVEGGVYYSYYAYAYEQPTFRWTYLDVTGDLDGDHVQDELQREWIYQNERLLKLDWAACNGCTIEYRTPANGVAF